MFKLFGMNKNKAQSLVSRAHKKYSRELKNMVRSELSLIFADIKMSVMSVTALLHISVDLLRMYALR